MEELKELPLGKLHEICEYLDIVFDARKDRDKKKLADLIMGQRNAHESDKRAGGMAGLNTWGTMHGFGGMGGLGGLGDD